MNEKLNEHPEVWNEFVTNYIWEIEKYHDMILNQVSKKVPIYYLRFEDLRTKPQETLEGLFAYLLEVPSVTGLNIQRRISEVIEMGHSATVVYD